MPRAEHVLTILAVADLTQARRLYDAAFGWETAVATPVYVEYALSGGQRIGLYERVSFGRNTGRAPGQVPPGETTATELYFRVEDVAGAAARLGAAGARLLSPATPRDWGETVAYFADLDGNVLAVAATSPRDVGA